MRMGAVAVATLAVLTGVNLATQTGSHAADEVFSNPQESAANA
jgi:hypothetical protein